MRSPCHFITEFVLLIKTPLFCEVNSFNTKWLAKGFQNKPFIIIFRPKVLFFVTYSNLIGQTKVESVIYWALNTHMLRDIARFWLLSLHSYINGFWNSKLILISQSLSVMHQSFRNCFNQSNELIYAQNFYIMKIAFISLNAYLKFRDKFEFWKTIWNIKTNLKSKNHFENKQAILLPILYQI